MIEYVEYIEVYVGSMILSLLCHVMSPLLRFPEIDSRAKEEFRANINQNMIEIFEDVAINNDFFQFTSSNSHINGYVWLSYKLKLKI